VTVSVEEVRRRSTGWPLIVNSVLASTFGVVIALFVDSVGRMIFGIIFDRDPVIYHNRVEFLAPGNDIALAGGALATDEVMRRVEAGRPFRSAYREVAKALKAGESFDQPAPRQIISRRGSTGGLGNLGLPDLKKRIRQSRSWNAREWKRFQGAMTKLAGRTAPLPRRQAAPPS